MSAFAVAPITRADDANEHGQEDFGFEWKEVRELLEEEEDDARETEGERKREVAVRGGEVRGRGKESDEEGTKVGSQDEEKFWVLCDPYARQLAFAGPLP